MKTDKNPPPSEDGKQRPGTLEEIARDCLPGRELLVVLNHLEGLPREGMAAVMKITPGEAGRIYAGALETIKAHKDFPAYEKSTRYGKGNLVSARKYGCRTG